MIIGVDLETTGLDPRADGAQILEIALIAMSPDLMHEHSHYQAVVKLGPDAQMDNYVREMHSRNGLLDACGAAASSEQQIEACALSWLTRIGEHPLTRSERSPMFGSSPHFDRSWLAVHMPKLHNAFSHRNLDASTLWLWAEAQGGVVPSRPAGESHRALFDVRASVNLAHTSTLALIEAFAP